MPVKMRLATDGRPRGRWPRTARAEKEKSPSARSPDLVSGVKRLLQLADVVVKQLEVIGDFFFASDRRRQHEHLSACFARDGIRSLQIEIGFHHDHLYVLALHLLHQFDGVLRARWDAWPRLDVTDHIQVEMLRKVRP